MVLLRRHPRSVILGLAVTLVVAAAFVLWLMPQVGRGQAPVQPVIDTSAEVETSQCISCHATLGSANVPGLIFNHGNHLVVSCSACHYEMPHEAGQTQMVPMEVCFTCHGVQHGPQGELATSKCEKCHTKSFDLRPKTHVKDWPKKPHADYAKKNGVNDCMMCHESVKDCDTCHESEGLEIAPMPKAYQSIIAEQPKQPSVKVYPDQPTTMSQCQYCHPDLDEMGSFMSGRLIFAHGTHLQRSVECQACHPEFPHSMGEIARPDMLSCYRCHGLVHAKEGLVAGEDCEKCHPAKFDLKPPDHTSKFVKGSHKKRANKEPEYCAMCHEPQFCVDCHTGKKAKEGGPAKPVIPADHKKKDWTSKHGGIFLARRGSCGSCHDDPSCKRCHKTVMPHPTNWQAAHATAGEQDSEDCKVCHTDRSSCQGCHHDTVKRAALVAKNCTPCHDEMKHKPATDIKHKAFAEHAVHFDVYKKKGEPYTCDDCHVSFTTSSQAVQHTTNLKEAGHDVRLCYGCHGALDYRNVQIAPYPGAQLCLRCHKDLNV